MLNQVLSYLLILVTSFNCIVLSSNTNNKLNIESVVVTDYDDIIMKYCEQIDQGELLNLQVYVDIIEYLYSGKKYEQTIKYSKLGLQQAGWSEQYQYSGTGFDSVISILLYYLGLSYKNHFHDFQSAIMYLTACETCLKKIETVPYDQRTYTDLYSFSDNQILYNEFNAGYQIYYVYLLMDDMEKATAKRTELLSQDRFISIYQDMLANNELDDAGMMLADFYHELINQSFEAESFNSK